MGLRRGENFWLRLTTASTQCLRLSERFFSLHMCSLDMFLIFVVAIDTLKQALNREQCLNLVDVARPYSTDELRRPLTATVADWKRSTLTSNSRRSSVSGSACVMLHCRTQYVACVVVLSIITQSVTECRRLREHPSPSISSAKMHFHSHLSSRISSSFSPF